MAYLCGYGALAALGEALVARPALTWVRAQGIFHTTLAWEVPSGALLAVAPAALALFTLGLSSPAAVGRTAPLPLHPGFLLPVGPVCPLRSPPRPPRPP